MTCVLDRAVKKSVDSALTPWRGTEATRPGCRAIDTMKGNGGLKEFNRSFKQARKASPSIRYQDFLHVRKASMLEEMAREART
jgi:hypothetical protein